jgi:hypothetical protein
MNYYVKGDAAKADEIKAAFEKLGIDVLDFGFADKTVVYCSIGGACVQSLPYSINLMHILYSHPDYQELPLPKPHYDISNFHAGMPVLVRADNNCRWDYSVFSRITGNVDWNFAVCNGASVAQCIPFSDDTKHLLGTTDMCDEQYVNW